jgi:putative transposase
MEAADVRQLKDLEEENSRLKRMFADLSLENMILTTATGDALVA